VAKNPFYGATPNRYGEMIVAGRCGAANVGAESMLAAGAPLDPGDTKDGQ
jgi:hypothetical protein